MSFTVSMGDNDNGGGGAGGGASTSYGVGATTNGVGFSSTAALSYGRMPVDPGCGTVTFYDQYRYGHLQFTGQIDGLTIAERTPEPEFLSFPSFLSRRPGD